MAKKNTRRRIIDAAWRLFYWQGYDGTTVEEIVEESGTSRSSFYDSVNITNKKGAQRRKGDSQMNIRKAIDYSAMYTELDALIGQSLPQMELYRGLAG